MKLIVGMREFNTAATEGVVSVHNPISPAEVYSGQLITATLRITQNGKDFSRPVPVYRISPLGAEIDISTLSLEKLQIGTEIDLQLQIAQQRCNFLGITVASIISENSKRIMGVRWCQSQQTSNNVEEKRGMTRWLCGEYFLPTGVAPNPAKFNDFVYFTIVDISRSGMQIATSLRNKFLIPGMILEAGVSFPLIGQLTLDLKITNARIRSSGGKDFLALGTQLVNEDPETLETLGQYLMQFGPQLSPTDLRQQGFNVRSTEGAVDFSFVKTAEEYRQILGLRKLAYSQAGKADPTLPTETMSDIFDTKSRILFARHKNEIVGSLRITFHTPDEQNEYDQFVKFPDNFPRRDDLVVLSRICTHPAYRGSDLFYALMRHCVLAVLQSRRRYILGGCSDSLLPLYEKVGFKPHKDLRYSHATLKGIQEQIITADVLGILSGTDTTLGVWNEIYSDLTNYITHLYEIPFNPGMNFRLALYRAAAPFTRIFTKGVRYPKKGKSK